MADIKAKITVTVDKGKLNSEIKNVQNAVKEAINKTTFNVTPSKVDVSKMKVTGVNELKDKVNKAISSSGSSLNGQLPYDPKNLIKMQEMIAAGGVKNQKWSMGAIEQFRKHNYDNYVDYYGEIAQIVGKMYNTEDGKADKEIVNALNRNFVMNDNAMLDKATALMNDARKEMSNRVSALSEDNGYDFLSNLQTKYMSLQNDLINHGIKFSELSTQEFKTAIRDNADGVVKNYQRMIDAQDMLKEKSKGMMEVPSEAKSMAMSMLDRSSKELKDNAIISLMNKRKGELADSNAKLKTYEEMRNYLGKNSRMDSDSKNAITSMMEQIQSSYDLSKDDLKQIRQSFLARKQTINANGMTGMNWKDELKSNISKFSHWITATGAVFALISQGRQAISTIKALDASMTDLKKVTNESGDTYKKFYYEANGMAKNLGVSTNTVIRQTANWAQLGYSMRDSKELAKSTSIFKTISPEMDTELSQKTLVSVMKAYESEGINASNVLDKVGSKINEVGNNFAANNNDIAEILQNSASALKVGGNSLSQAIGLGTGAQEIIQNAPKVGNALKTLSMYARDEKKVGKVEAATGISAYTDSTRTQFKSTYDYLKDLNGAWKTLSDTQRAAVTKDLFGARNSNIGMAILDNWKNVEKATKTAEESSGSAMREFDKATNSLAFKLNRLQETGTGVWQKILNTDVIKGGVDALSSLLGVLEKLIGLFNSIPGGAITQIPLVLSAISAFKGKSIIGFDEMNNLGDKTFFNFDGKKFRKVLGGDIKNLGKAFSQSTSLGEYLTGISGETKNNLINDFNERSMREFASNTLSPKDAFNIDDLFKSNKAARKDGINEYLKGQYEKRQSLIKEINDKYDMIGPLTKEQKDNYLAELRNAAESTKVSMEGLNASLKSQSSIFSTLKTGAASFASTILSIGVNMAASLAVFGAIALAVSAYKKFNPSQSDLDQKMKDADSKLAETKQKLQEVQDKRDSKKSELSRLENRDDVQGNKAIQNRISSLKEEIKLLNQKEKILQHTKGEDAKELAKDTIEATNKRFDFRKGTGKGSGIGGIFKSWENTKDNKISYHLNSDGSYQLSKISKIFNFDGAGESNISMAVARYKKLSKKRTELINSGKVDSKEFEDVDKKFSKSADTIRGYEKSLVESSQNIKVAYEDIKNSGKNASLYTDDEKNIVDSYNTYKKMTDQMQKLTDPVDYYSSKFSQIFSTDGIEKTRDQLIDLANTSNETDFANMINGSENLKGALEDAGITVSEFQDYLKSMQDDGTRWSTITQQNKDDIKSMTNDLEDMLSVMDKLEKAKYLDEAVSSTGLRSDTIALLKQYYSEAKSFNENALFENTDDGVRLNYKELHKYNEEIASSKIESYNNKIKELSNDYVGISESIGKAVAGTDEYNQLISQRDAIEGQIRSLERLKSEAEGATSLMTQWTNAMSSQPLDSNYQAIVSSKDDMQKLRDEGRVGDERFMSYTAMLTGKKMTELDKMDAQEIAKLYDDKAIRNLKRYFDESGKGYENMAKDLIRIGQLSKDANGVITGSINAEEAAKKLGVSKDVIQMWVETAKEHKLDVNVSSDGVEQMHQAETNFINERQKKSNDNIASIKNDKNVMKMYEGRDLDSNLADSQEFKDLNIDVSSLDQAKESLTQVTEAQKILKQEFNDGNGSLRITKEQYDAYNKSLEDTKKNIQDVIDVQQGASATKISGGGLTYDIHDTDQVTKMTGDLQKLQDKFATFNGIKFDGLSNMDSSQLDNLYSVFEEKFRELSKKGKLKVGVEGYDEALNIFNSLLNARNQAERPAILKIKTDTIKGDTGEALKALQNVYKAAQQLNNLEIKKSIGFEVNQAELDAAKNQLKNSINSFNEKDKGGTITKTLKLNFNADSSAKKVKGQLDSLSQGDISKKLNVDKTSWENYHPTKKKIELNTKEALSGVKKVKNEISKIPSTKTVKIQFRQEGLAGISFATGNVSSKKSGGKKKSSGKKSSVSTYVPHQRMSGLQMATGTFTGYAFAQGTRGRIKQSDSGKALVGELGQELVVRDGEYFTVGDNGAEMFDYRRGDIIFNHLQTKELLENGSIYGSGGSYASGNAFSTGIRGRLLSGSGSSKKKKKKKKTTRKTTRRKSSSRKSSSKSRKSSSRSRKSSSSKKGSSSSADKKDPTTFDWIEVKLKRIEEALSRVKAVADNVYNSWGARNSSLNQQISKTREDLDAQGRAYNAYINAANKVGLSADWAAKVRNGEYNINDVSDENLVKKINKYKDYYDKAQSALTKQKELEKELDDALIKKFENKAKEYEDRISTYEKANDKLSQSIELNNYQSILKENSLLRNQRDNNLAILSELKNERNELSSILGQISTGGASGITNGSEGYYTQLNKIKDIETNIVKLQVEISKSAKDMFDSITTSFESRINYIEARSTMIKKLMDTADAKGVMSSEKYYRELINVSRESLAKMNEERNSLENSLLEGLANGSIVMYSKVWYDMTKSISDVDEKIEDMNKSLAEFNQSMKEVSWKQFDRMEDGVNDLADELSFLMNILSSGNDRFEENGKMRDSAMASLGIMASRLDILTKQASQYRNAIRELDNQYADDRMNTKYLDQRNKLIETQRNVINNVYKEREAIKSLIKDGYDKQLNYLNKLISKRKEALSKQLEAYQYQRTIEEKTKNVSNYQKQVMAFGGDNSEEGRLNAQNARENLRKSKDDLKQTEWEKYISDTSELLDKLSSETQDWINKRLDNIDELITNAQATVDDNQKRIDDTIRNEIANNGIVMSDQFNAYLSENGMFTVKVDAGMNAIKNSIDSLTDVSTRLADAVIGEINKKKEAELEKKRQAEEAERKKREAAEAAARAKAEAEARARAQAQAKAQQHNNNGGVNFVHKNDSYPKNRLKRYGSIVDALKYFNYDSSFSQRANYFRQMGGSGTYRGSASQNMWMLQKFRKIKGYASGGIVGDIENIIRGNGDDHLTINTLKKGEAVLDPSTTKIIQKLNTTAPMINNIVNGMRESGNIKVDSVHVDINLPNVKSYKDFRNELINDKQFDKAINDMVSTTLMGGNSLSKRKYMK